MLSDPAETLHVPAGADQLVVAIALRPGLAGLAYAGPVARWRTVDLHIAIARDELAGAPVPPGRLLADLRQRQRPRVGEARVFLDDARVEHTDDHVLAFQEQTFPQPLATVEQAEKLRRIVGVDLDRAIFPDLQHLLVAAQLAGFDLGQLRGESVERMTVAVDLAVPGADGSQDVVLTRAEVLRILLHVARARVVARAAFRRRPR